MSSPIATPPVYSTKEEIANAATHGIGALFAIAALVLMVVYSAMNGSSSHVVSSSIFGASLVILYMMSTLYHLVRGNRAKQLFRALDHSSIYLLIAGTYTPFTLVSLAGGWGWSLFAMVWSLAIAGILLETLLRERFTKKYSLLLYISMGWLIVVAVKPLLQNIPFTGIFLLVAGGFLYTFGVIFYVWKSLFYNHAIWHLFVLGGSILHFLCVFYYVIP